MTGLVTRRFPAGASAPRSTTIEAGAAWQSMVAATDIQVEIVGKIFLETMLEDVPGLSAASPAVRGVLCGLAIQQNRMLDIMELMSARITELEEAATRPGGAT